MDTILENAVVYIVHCTGSTYYKIGITGGDMTTRLNALQSSCPFKLVVEFMKHFSIFSAAIIERQLHNLFHQQRVRGEWFDLDVEKLEKVIIILENSDKCILTTDEGMKSWINTILED